MKLGGSELTRIGNDTALVKKSDTPTALQQRREMMLIPQVNENLSKTERRIFEASAQTPIGEIPADVLREKFKAFILTAARDVGVRLPQSQNDPAFEGFQYDLSRMIKILVNHYALLTMQDLRMAIDLMLVCELDEFFSKDRNGQPEKNHYQQFNADYLTKILNAYSRKQSQVITKAYEALPAAKIGLSEEREKEIRLRLMNEIRDIISEYREKGIIRPMSNIDIIIYHDIFNRWGICPRIEISDDDRSAAFSELLNASIRTDNEYDRIHIRKQGESHPRVENVAKSVAQRSAVYEAIVRIVSEKIDIEKFIQEEI